MKKISRLWIIIPLLTLFVYSCKKEQEPMTNSMDQSLIEKSQQIIQRIEAFDTKLTGNFKSGENISVDSLVWYTEALENYNNARPDLAYENFVVSKTTYTVTLDNGNLSMEDAAALYSIMQADLETELANLDPTDDKLKLTDVALDSIEGNTAYLSVKRVIGLKLIAGTYLPFQNGVDWYWGTLNQESGYPPLGKCDGTMIGISDASDELTRKLNHPDVIPAQPYIYTDIISRTTDGFVYDSRLYVGWNYPENNCLASDTLNYYLEQSHLIINDISEGLRPPGLDFSHVSILDELVPGGEDRSWHFHFYTVSYGVKVIAGQETD
ncbi:MAG: hypothetical protein PHG67_10820 [Bacteroidales bacterium]|nr:hypothetical protein [Bacteroidales bacterium]